MLRYSGQAARGYSLTAERAVILRRHLDCDAFNLHLADGSAAGQVVMHAHLHVIPRGVEDGFRWNWRQLKYQDGEASEIAEKIIAKLKVD